MSHQGALTKLSGLSYLVSPAIIGIVRAMPNRPRNLPTPPSIVRTLGPSFILLGLALGSGELILWPYLTAQYGLGLLWGGLLGITLQFVLNTEAMRYTLAWGWL